VLTGLQYALLKRLAPADPGHMTGAAYAGKSKLRLLLGDTLVDELKGKTVVDFGCGEGAEAVELAVNGAARVIGVDIQRPLLEIARRRAEAAGVAGICEFANAPGELADAIVSLDSFEHFENPEAILATMFAMLKPGGWVVTSFGPTWYHPYGGHLFSIFPWAHLIFSERALIRWRSDLRSDGATRFGEVAGGLNQMTIARFESMVRRSQFSIDRLEPAPIRGLKPLHCRLTREWTTAVVRAKLRKA
jgi:SAM-dependent methyltransferase